MKRGALGNALVALVFLYLHQQQATGASQRLEERLIGWQGETYKPLDGAVDDGGHPHISEEASSPRPWVQVISWRPRAFVYKNFLSELECRHILKLSRNQMKRSAVVGPNDTGVVDEIRTSAGTFIRRNQDPVIAAMEQRLAVWTMLPPSHQEDLQVLRYGPTNKYGAHIDGLGRVATVLMYIVPPKSGGETAFTQSEGWSHPDLAKRTGPLSRCAAGHVAYKPQRGDALLFYDTMPDYRTEDGASMHTGCPVIEGVKWNAVKWIHGVPFRGEEYNQTLHQPYKPMPDPGECKDLEEQHCKMWTESGECKKNPGYMIGGPHDDGIGQCRLSCGACEVCDPKDRACYVRNFQAGGFMAIDPEELRGLVDDETRWE